ncbi:MAG: sulfatase-like hydrolase/transferase [Planctomycetia bacterium]|nr:sulfatase-like hydrolase/transferase [Planctomycetia bacterium]
MNDRKPTSSEVPLPRPLVPPAARWLLLAFIAAPSVLRLATMIWQAPHAVGLPTLLRVGSRVMFFSLPQDAFIAVQALAVIAAAGWLFKRLGEPWRWRLSAALATALFVALHFYLLVDFLLFNKTGLRMDYELLAFAADLETMSSSAVELGLGGLAAGVAALVVSLPLLFLFFRRQVQHWQPSWRLAAMLPVLAAIALLARAAIPAQVGYATNNLLLADETRLVSLVLTEPAAVGGDDDGAIELLTPKAEVFRRTSPDYPLLKETVGFTGEKQFEIAIAEGERPHVVFLFLESFRALDVGVLGGRHNVSPNFDRLSQGGILFTNFYGNGVQTSRAVVASLFGVLPCFSPMAEQESRTGVPMIGLADLFNRRGYQSAYFFAGPLAFESQDPFFKLHGYHELYGQEQMAPHFKGAARTSWGLHDECLVRYAADWLAGQDAAGQPAQMTMFTITNHHPWHVPPDYQPPTTAVDPDQEYARFLQTFSYTDRCLGLFMRLLGERGLAKKTIVFVLADTGTPMGEHHGNHLLINYLYEENMRIPLLILAPGRIARPVKIDDVASQVDLLPTVMDIFGMQGLNHAVGTSLVRRVPGRTVYFNNPFAMQYLGLRRDKWKFIFNVAAEAPALYDVSADARESVNLLEAKGARPLPNVDSLRGEAKSVNDLMLKLWVTERFVSPALVERAGQPGTGGASGARAVNETQ